MKSSAAIRRKYVYSSFIKNFLKSYGWCFLIFVTLILISVFTGAFSVTKFDGGLSENDFFDKVLLKLCDGKLTFWSVLFNRVFCFLTLLFISFLTAQNKFLIAINVIVVIICGYLVGVDIGIIFSIFSIRGIVFTLVIYIPLMLASIISLLLINCVLIKKGKEYSKYGSVCSKKDINIILIGTLVISIILQCSILPFFNNIFLILE